ncbi:hypothetical protein GYMLUDRAFT_35745 [Collybiopsis luxurians FD-317 M1]|nr:hypothetical protein GYMLUDRAFT_35745 [Collybiopsis luxurians FD-317 M1]
MAEGTSTQESRWAFSQTFLSDFQTSRLDLETRLQQATQSGGPIAKPELDNLNLLLAKLSKSLVDATGSITNFDQRNCETQLNKLGRVLESLRKVSSGTSKFAFRRKAKEVSASLPETVAATGASNAATVSPSTTLTLSSYSERFITPEDLPSPHATSSDLRSELSITNLDGCLLNLLDSPYEISALHIRDVKNSILLLPALDGSVILHDLRNCVVVVKCHQFRMHASKDTDVYLRIQSSPTIEHCSGISFAPYPPAFSSSDLHETPDLLVQDFSHINSTPSPNWCFMAEEQRKSDNDWHSIIGRTSVDVKGILQRALPPYSSTRTS